MKDVIKNSRNLRFQTFAAVEIIGVKGDGRMAIEKIPLKNRTERIMADKNTVTGEVFCLKKHVFKVEGGTYTCRTCNKSYRRV